MWHYLELLWTIIVFVNFCFIAIFVKRYAPKAVAKIRNGQNETLVFLGVIVLVCVLGIFAILTGPIFSILAWQYLLNKRR